MRLDHIGIAVAELAAADTLVTRLLGRQPYKRETVERQGVVTSFFRAEAGEAKIELVAPVPVVSAEGATRGPAPNPIGKFLDKRGPGLHHLAFEVEDIRAEMRRLAQDGFELLQAEPSRGADNKLVCFLHPRTTNGVLVEICQSTDA